MNIEHLQTEAQVREALPVLQELRPQLEEEEYWQLWQQMKQEGYQLFALRGGDGQIAALAGAAVLTNFYNKKHVFVYDLVTTESARSRGYGEQLLTYVEDWGRHNGCEAVSLTSGLQRLDAHRFYEERMQYSKTSFAFRKTL